MLWKMTVAATLGIGTLFAAGCADTAAAARNDGNGRYEMVRTSHGPRPEQSTYVRVWREGSDQPYALTGQDTRTRRPILLTPPKGTHANQ
jgi:hypothetical protein